MCIRDRPSASNCAAAPVAGPIPLPKSVTTSPGATAPLRKLAALVTVGAASETGGDWIVKPAVAIAVGAARLCAVTVTVTGE